MKPMEEMTEERFFELADKAEANGKKLIALFEDADGNWRGGLKEKGKHTFVRDVGPETVLQLLLTHNGK